LTVFLWERVVAHYLRGWSGRVVLSSNGTSEGVRGKFKLVKGPFFGSGNRIPLL
jgi:hypothetical protein